MGDYTAKELEAYANQMLRSDIAENKDGPRVLFQEHIEPKWRKEVRSESGTVDDAVTNAMSRDGQRMYNRTHPAGRKVNSAEARKRHGASYYRVGGIASIAGALIGLPIYLMVLILSVELALNLYGYFRTTESG